MRRKEKEDQPQQHACCCQCSRFDRADSHGGIIPPGPGGASAGLGETGTVQPLLDPELYDEILLVNDEEAIEAARRLAREEGLIAGFSAGANLCGALRVAARMSPGQTVVTLICDTGFRYLSTELFGVEGPGGPGIS